MSSAETASHGSRARAVQDWLARRADTALGRLSLQWFRAYFAASRNSGCAVTIYSALRSFRQCRLPRSLPPVGERHQRLRRPPGRAPETERLHGEPRPRRVRKRLVQCARRHRRDRSQLPALGHRDRPDLPGRLLACLGNQGRIGGRPGAVRDLLLRPQRALPRSPSSPRRSSHQGMAPPDPRLDHRLDHLLAVGAAIFSCTGRSSSAHFYPGPCSRPSSSAAPPPRRRSSWRPR